MATNPPIQIGELTDVPQPGAGVKSAWAQEVTHRIHHRFANIAARAAAFTAPLPVAGKGEPSYLATNNETEGPEYFDGVAWRKPWNLPWGTVGYGRNIAGQAGIGTTIVDIANLSVTWIAVTNRLYRVTLSAMFNSVNGAAVVAYVTDAANGGLAQCNLAPNTVVSAQMASISMLFTPAPGSYTVKTRASTGGSTTSLVASATIPAFLIVEDAGPAPGVAPA